MTDEGLVAVQLKKPFRDGTGSVEMNPLSLDLPSPATIGAVMTTLNGWEPGVVSHPAGVRKCVPALTLSDRARSFRLGARPE
jgi:hypothetical protein